MSLLNLVNEIQTERLIPDAHFQRNLVWRDVHKREFIKTILLGLPFPQIFISKGKVNVEKMSTTSCIVDGQQRSHAIMAFVRGEFDVEGRRYADLTEPEKADFLKYEIAVMELELENDDPKVKDIFQRINRTSNSLTAIEKLASEFSTSEYMLVAKHLSAHISLERSNDEDFREDPNIPDSFYSWAKTADVGHFTKLLNDKGVFSAHELARKANLQHTLNIMAAVLGGYSNRNERATQHLEDYAQDFPAKDAVVEGLERAAEFVLSLRLPLRSYWLNKANMFSLVVETFSLQADGGVADRDVVSARLREFLGTLPEDYRLAASESVNSTKARQLRGAYLRRLLA